ncbi:MAG TPA: bifunctional hydroxymethylpyrimidine kinase/phosphomethylpyrimidine kinase [Rhizomicrobium sp.]|jgi:hydroxymethylpyrimidine/phosphomethylpyrimidine kinase|nr:bifunctional hydroxymethylpyrimidine kinase/phosphomethylpyrimidine kinase [Rhizomicrobium sp.]
MTSRLLVIAGSDSSGGAGIQADLKTAQAFGVYAQTAITAVTVQDTGGVRSVNPVAPEIVRAQIEAGLNDIGADAIKIGMLGNGGIAAAVADVLERVSLPLVLDTVLLSSSGAPLLDEAGITVLKTRLMRRAALVTPNLPEAEALTGIYPKSEHRLRNAAMVFRLLGVQHVLFKGGHGEGAVLRDVLWSDGEFTSFEAPRQQTPHTHGTGCSLATAIACGLAQNLPLNEAVARAHAYVQEAIRTAPGLGMGSGPLNHLTT